MDVDINKWFRCEVDKKEFKELSKKSDWQGFKHIIIYFSFLGLFGYYCVLIFIFNINMRSNFLVEVIVNDTTSSDLQDQCFIQLSYTPK